MTRLKKEIYGKINLWNLNDFDHTKSDLVEIVEWYIEHGYTLDEAYEKTYSCVIDNCLFLETLE